MKKIILIIYFFFVTSFCFAQEPPLDKATIDLCNNIILNIYNDIFEIKDNYVELLGFSETALFKNKHGIYTLVYQDATNQIDARLKAPYAFGVTIDRVNDDTFQPQKGSFITTFPALNLKFSAYQNKPLLRTQYDVSRLVKKYIVHLTKHQQNYLSVRLQLQSAKTTYKIGEPLQIEVVLSNNTKTNLIVNPLGNHSLTFFINGREWRLTDPNPKTGMKKRLLKAGQSITALYQGEAFFSPQDIQISCVYDLKVQGINPTGFLDLAIVE